ncbi:Mo-dependent nitrogenase C-terminal domain-containing protein [Scytonema sp. HK-05]|uniref:Mo-dependent nitrogenase C-terminal domain-containing protein n=1 Tax=Scytonema sp. HK-05 TaxID=1137095 RepID=UPI0009357C9F|nr:hypothetical protein NIES2130_21925 [Scytonema sp. HK-05]
MSEKLNFVTTPSGRIPPLRKLNPAYEQVVSLRFKALSYLADECGEDVARGLLTELSFTIHLTMSVLLCLTVISYQLSVISYQLSVTSYQLLAVYCLLFTVYCSLFTVHCLLFTVYCSLV